MDSHSSTTTGFFWLFPDLPCAWAPFNPPANNQIKIKRNLLGAELDFKPEPMRSGLSLPPFGWCVCRLEAAEMEERTEKRCRHHYNPFILLYDWRLCECVKTRRLGMPGRRWRAQVSSCRMHQKHLYRGRKNPLDICWTKKCTLRTLSLTWTNKSRQTRWGKKNP